MRRSRRWHTETKGPRGLALSVRELDVPADYSKTSGCCSSSMLTTENDGGRVVDEKHTLVRVHVGQNLVTSRERRDAHPGRTSIGVGTCLRLNLEPRRLLHHRRRLPAWDAPSVSGTLVNRLDRLRDYRHAQWSRRSSPSPSARRSARRSVTRYMAYVPADQLLDCRCGGQIARDPDHRIQIHSGSMDPVG